MNTTTFNRPVSIPVQPPHNSLPTANNSAILLDADAPPFLAPKGTWFDEAVDLREPDGSQFTDDVLTRIAPLEPRQRSRRESAEANHRQIVRKILANGFRCFLHRDPAWVAYFRKAGSYRDSPAWLSGKTMSRTVDLMAEANLLQTNLGEYGRASTYQITQTLHEIGERHSIGDNSLTLRLPPKKLVRLRSERPQRTEMDFAASDDTQQWTAQIDAYNDFLTQQNIALAISGAEEIEWAARLNAQGINGSGMPFYRPERFQTDLYRQFNNGSFNQGGRLYGGWWINAPKKLRRKITINGQPTVELDYSGCAIRMLYHERGIDYRADPYALPPLAAYQEKEGLEADHYREGVKALMQALINGDYDGKPEMARIEGFSFRPAFKRSEIRQMIEEKHKSISGAFGSGAGLRLQRQDSDLALAIITKMQERGIATLPIHDSFIAPKENEFDLKDEMNGMYKNMFTYYPIIK